MAPTWYRHALASGPGAPWWEYGPLTIDAGGHFEGAFHEYGTPLLDYSQGQLLVGDDGVLTVVGGPENPNDPGYAHGHLAADENVIVAVSTFSTGSPGTTEINVWTRQGSNYQLSDLAGTWYRHALASGEGAPWWEYGTMTIEPDGSFSGTFREYGTVEPDEWHGQFQMDSEGGITIVGKPQDPTARGHGHLHMAADKDVVAGVATWSSGPLSTEIDILTRAGSGFQTSDLAGKWHVHSLASGPGEPWWQYGLLQVETDGSFTGTLREYGDTGPDSISGRFEITPDGVVVVAQQPQEQHGHMTPDRSLIVMVDTWTTGSPGTSELRILTRGVTGWRLDWNGDCYRSIIGDVPPFVNCVYFGDCPPDAQTIGDCNDDGIISIVGDVPCFVDCVYFGDCPQ